MAYLQALENNMFMCLFCQKRIPRKDNAKRHVKLKHLQTDGGGEVTCDLCQKSFKGNLNLDDHKRRYHGIYKTVQQ